MASATFMASIGFRGWFQVKVERYRATVGWGHPIFFFLCDHDTLDTYSLLRSIKQSIVMY